MTLHKHLLALVDPSQAVQPALRRARFNATKRGEKPKLTVFMAVDRELHKQLKRQPVLYRDPQWIEDRLARLKEAGLEHELAISWDDEWADSVNEQVNTTGADLVMAPVYRDEDGNKVITDEMWRLLRTSSVNVSMIQPGNDDYEDRKVILAAIKTQDPSFAERNERTIQNAKTLAELYGAKLYVVNVYATQDQYPDRAKIIQSTGVANENIFVEAGDVAEVIANVAKRVNADMLLLAPAPRKGLAAALRGATINRVIKKVDCDVMAVV